MMAGCRMTVSLGDSSQVYAALTAVLDLHKRIGECCQSCWVAWPCLTITAVDQHMYWPPAHENPDQDG